MKIIEPDLIDVTQVERELTQAFNDLVNEAEEAFQLSYHNWDNKPNFYTTTKLSKDKTIEYSTEDENYVRIDDGTEPHDITGNPFLKFKTPSVPKTEAGRVTSFSGFGGRNWNTRQKVRHSGIEPRLFSDQVVAIIEKSVEDRFDQAMLRVNSL